MERHNIQEEQEEIFSLHFSEGESSQEQVDEEFTLQLSEGEDTCNSQKTNQEQGIITSKSSQSDQTPDSSIKHATSDNHIVENSAPSIKCCDSCIVSKELLKPSNEAFEENADAKQENEIKQSKETKKRPSSEDTPIKFFKIFRSFFKDNAKEHDTIDLNGGDTSHNVPQEIQKPTVPETTEITKSAKEGKASNEGNPKKQLKKPCTEANSSSKRIHFCTTCRVQVESLTDLKQHHRMHSENKTAYQCSLCQRTFVSKYVLKRHLLTHSGDRRYTCSICDKKFMRSDYLFRHRKLTHAC